MPIGLITDGEVGSGVRAKLNAALTVINSFTSAYTNTSTNVNNGIVGVNSAGTFYNTGTKLHVATGAFLLAATATIGMTSSNAYSIGMSSSNVNLNTTFYFSKTDYTDTTLEHNLNHATGSAGFHLAPNMFFAGAANNAGVLTSIQGASNSLVVSSTYSSFAGWQYGSDFGANYTARSLPDWGNVQSYVGTALSSYLPLSGGTLTGPVYYSGTISNANEYVNKSYVDNLLTGITWKEEVVVRTTANITLSGTQTIDGIVLAVGNRVLVMNQTTATQNGIYIVQSGAWIRATDADTGTEIARATVLVSDGTTYANTQYTCSNTSVTLGSTNITFVAISGVGTYTNGSYLSLTGNVFNINFASFDTDSITQGSTNKYFSNTLARGAFSGTAPISYNSSTGAFSMAAATSSVNGYLSSTDWSAFDGKNNLTSTYVGYGASGKITGASTFTYDTTGLNVGNATRTSQSMLRVGQGSSFVDIGSITSSPSNAAIYMNQATPGGTNYAMFSNGTNVGLNIVTGGSLIFRLNGGNDMLTITGSTVAFTPNNPATGLVTPISFTLPAITGQTAGSETIAVNYNLFTCAHLSSTGIATNRDILIQARTHSFASATGTITDGDTLHITGGPIAGTNAAITRSWAARFGGNFAVNGKTYLGAFGAAPTSTLDLASISNGAQLRLIANASAASAQDGDIWYDGTNIKMKIGGVDKTFTLV